MHRLLGSKRSINPFRRVLKDFSDMAFTFTTNRFRKYRLCHALWPLRYSRCRFLNSCDPKILFFSSKNAKHFFLPHLHRIFTTEFPLCALIFSVFFVYLHFTLMETSFENGLKIYSNVRGNKLIYFYAINSSQDSFIMQGCVREEL